ncbi:ArsR/SmtB family transcription factor [Rhodopseudomonas sp.]|uniref:ArsR/SmtB family transcription factor n=1 Tax=Rhodopseudomonas sp. TaxID=1078 RepID=UPI0039E4F1F1
MTRSTIATDDSVLDDLPPPLPEPATEDLRLDIVMGALADPLRLTIIRKLLLESEAYDHTCGWFGFDRPKSSLTHHFKALREAGLIRQRQYGLERRSRVRTEDLDARFPGLLDLVKAWRPKGQTDDTSCIQCIPVRRSGAS